MPVRVSLSVLCSCGFQTALTIRLDYGEVRRNQMPQLIICRRGLKLDLFRGRDGFTQKVKELSYRRYQDGLCRAE